jgi:hypothetical protein
MASFLWRSESLIRRSAKLLASWKRKCVRGEIFACLINDLVSKRGAEEARDDPNLFGSAKAEISSGMSSSRRDSSSRRERLRSKMFAKNFRPTDERSKMVRGSQLTHCFQIRNLDNEREWRKASGGRQVSKRI